MKWSVNWKEYYDAEGPKEITGMGNPKKNVNPSDLIGKRILAINTDDYGEMIFETED